MSAVAILLPILAEIGAPILKGLITKRFGKTAGDVADTVVGSIADKLGVEPTPEAIADKYATDPEAVSEAALAVETEWAKVARDAMALHGQYLEGIQADTLAGGINSFWRPVNGILYALGSFSVLLTVCIAILNRIPLDESLMPVIALVGAVIGPWAGVVGYYVGQRTKEKIG